MSPFSIKLIDLFYSSSQLAGIRDTADDIIFTQVDQFAPDTLDAPPTGELDLGQDGLSGWLADPYRRAEGLSVHFLECANISTWRDLEGLRYDSLGWPAASRARCIRHRCTRLWGLMTVSLLRRQTALLKAASSDGKVGPDCPKLPRNL